MTRAKKRGVNRANLYGYILVAPMVLGICVFIIYPMLMALNFSFHRTDGVTGVFVGLNNYIWLFQDNLFWQAMYNTILMAFLSVVSGVTICFILASLINSLSRGKNFFKCLFFLPNVVSIVAATILFTFVLHPTQAGLVNAFLGIFGIAPLPWFSHPAFAPYSIVLLNLWRSFGYDTIIFLAGLQSVPRELYEAANVDGANALKRWWYITVPSMRPVLFFVIIMYTINSLRRINDVLLIGGVAGNPGGALQTIVLYIYRNAFTAGQVGLASAAAYALFIVCLSFTFINYRIMKAGEK